LSRRHGELGQQIVGSRVLLSVVEQIQTDNGSEFQLSRSVTGLSFHFAGDLSVNELRQF